MVNLIEPTSNSTKIELAIILFLVLVWKLVPFLHLVPTEMDIKLMKVKMDMADQQWKDWDNCFPSIEADDEYWNTAIPQNNTSAKTEEVRGIDQVRIHSSIYKANEV